MKSSNEKTARDLIIDEISTFLRIKWVDGRYWYGCPDAIEYEHIGKVADILLNNKDILKKWNNEIQQN